MSDNSSRTNKHLGAVGMYIGSLALLIAVYVSSYVMCADSDEFTSTEQLTDPSIPMSSDLAREYSYPLLAHVFAPAAWLESRLRNQSTAVGVKGESILHEFDAPLSPAFH